MRVVRWVTGARLTPVIRSKNYRYQGAGLQDSLARDPFATAVLGYIKPLHCWVQARLDRLRRAPWER